MITSNLFAYVDYAMITSIIIRLLAFRFAYMQYSLKPYFRINQKAYFKGLFYLTEIATA